MLTDDVILIGDEALARGIGKPLGVLRRYAPELVAELKEEFPDLADLVDKTRAGGVMLGGGPSDPRLVAKTWIKALSAQQGRSRKALPRIRQRLDRADQAELLSQVVAAISGCTLLGLLVGSTGTTGSAGQIAAAVVTLIGTVSALVAGHLRRASGGGGSLVDRYVNLTRLAAECATLQIELPLWAASNGEPAGKGDDLCARASNVFKEMSTLLPDAA